MTREQCIVNHLNMTEKRIEHFVKSKDNEQAMRLQMYQLGQLEMLNSLGYLVVESEEECRNVDGIWISKYTSIEDKG